MGETRNPSAAGKLKNSELVDAKEKAATILLAAKNSVPNEPENWKLP
ncbi:MAG: hypothetical protein LAO06_13550 [Acidobacteriia bacterium]|nr:hypothetical protein [Terriglobia bacterium]